MDSVSIDPTLVHDDQDFGLGQRYRDDDGKEYMFIEADEALAAGDVCIIELSDFGSAKANHARLDVNGPVGVANHTIASGKFSWIQIYGKTGVKVAAMTAAAGGLVPYTSATNGTLDDDTSSQTKVSGIYLGVAALTAGTRDAFLTYPKGSD